MHDCMKPYRQISVLTGRVSWRRGLFGRKVVTVQERFQATQGYKPRGVYQVSRSMGEVWEVWRDATPQDLEEMGHQLMKARNGDQA